VRAAILGVRSVAILHTKAITRIAPASGEVAATCALAAAPRRLLSLRLPPPPLTLPQMLLV
jgi:hypothetical protein